MRVGQGGVMGGIKDRADPGSRPATSKRYRKKEVRAADNNLLYRSAKSIVPQALVAC